MSFFKPRFVLLALMCALPPALASSGCSGTAFTTSDDTDSAGMSSTAGTSSSSAGTSSGASAGTGAGGGANLSCNGPEDCDDKNVCTLDRCNPDGTCDASPRCPGSEKCCAGECAQCCDHADCDDGVSCTMNTCFAGQCMFVPNDAACAAAEYCSTKENCVARQACTGLAGEAASVCDDDDACTEDSCVDNFCEHAFCQDGDAKLCCEGVGCAACCNDSQCDTDEDPCTVGACEGGKCSVVPLCGKDQQCCPSADGLSATCGSCCNAVDCDDRVGCTVDQCGGGTCSNTPSAELCPAGYLCDVEQGKCLKAPDCTLNTDCKPNACQRNGKCLEGSCHFDDCAAGTTCCANGSGCGACCADAECDDLIPCTKDVCGDDGCTHTPDNGACGKGYACNVTQGCVRTCEVEADCSTGVIGTAAIIGITPACTTYKCIGKQCVESTVLCTGLQTCCPATGTCTLPNKCLQTQ